MAKSIKQIRETFARCPFNNPNKKTRKKRRVLTLEIVPDLAKLRPDEEGCSVDDSSELKTKDEGSCSVVDLGRKRKRSREEIKARANEAIGRLEESPSDIVITRNHSLCLRTIIHISSPILAEKSVFFLKLFSNGTGEQRHLIVQIHESEEAAFMDLLKFMYCNTLSTTTPTGLLDVLMAADRFEVASCMTYCRIELQKQHTTTETALLYLDLPSKISTVDVVQPLVDAARLYFVLRFRDITKFQEEALNLPLSGIKVVLSSSGLQSASEDAVYDFALKWAHKHYPDLEDRRKVWTSHLCYLIRFPYMTCMKLKKIMTCSDFDQDLDSRLVLEALFYKAEEPHQQRAIVAKVENAYRRCYVERAYKYKAVKVLEFVTPHQQCVVHLDLDRCECAFLYPAGKVFSQTFHLGGRELFLAAYCNMDPQGAVQCLGLFLGMHGKESEPLAVDYEFAVRMSPRNEYVSKHKGNYTLTSGVVVGCRNLCGVDWTAFLKEDSLYFIKGVIYLRAVITIRE